MISARHCFNVRRLKTTAEIFWIICCTYKECNFFNEIQSKNWIQVFKYRIYNHTGKGKIYDVKWSY